MASDVPQSVTATKHGSNQSPSELEQAAVIAIRGGEEWSTVHTENWQAQYFQSTS